VKICQLVDADWK